MSDVTHLLDAVAAGNRQAAADLLPLVYDELRKLAALMAAEGPGHTFDATTLVHEAYLWLVGGENRPTWEHRRQFVAAADKHGGGRDHVPLEGLPSLADNPGGHGSRSPLRTRLGSR